MDSGSKLRSRIPESVEKCVGFLDSFYLVLLRDRPQSQCFTTIPRNKWSLTFCCKNLKPTIHWWSQLLMNVILNFFTLLKLVSPKDRGSIVRLSIIYIYPLRMLFIATPFTESIGIMHSGNKQALVCLCVCIYHPTSTLEHTLIFLKCMVNEHVFFLSLASFTVNFSLAYFETCQNSVCFGNQ